MRNFSGREQHMSAAKTQSLIRINNTTNGKEARFGGSECHSKASCICGIDFAPCVNVIRPCDKVAQISTLGGDVAPKHRMSDILEQG
jgi:hypothetical protein